MAAVEVLVLCDVLLFNALFSLFTLQSFLNKVWKKTMPASRVVRFFQIINVIHTTFIRTSGLELLDLRGVLHILQRVKWGRRKSSDVKSLNGKIILRKASAFQFDNKRVPFEKKS